MRSKLDKMGNFKPELKLGGEMNAVQTTGKFCSNKATNTPEASLFLRAREARLTLRGQKTEEIERFQVRLKGENDLQVVQFRQPH